MYSHIKMIQYIAKRCNIKSRPPNKDHRNEGNPYDSKHGVDWYE